MYRLPVEASSRCNVVRTWQNRRCRASSRTRTKRSKHHICTISVHSLLQTLRLDTKTKWTRRRFLTHVKKMCRTENSVDVSIVGRASALTTYKYLIHWSTFFSLAFSRTLSRSFLAHTVQFVRISVHIWLEAQKAVSVRETVLSTVPSHRHNHPRSRSTVSVGSLVVRVLVTSLRKMQWVVISSVWSYCC